MNRENDSHPEGPRRTDFFTLFKQGNRAVFLMNEAMANEKLLPDSIHEQAVFLHHVLVTVARFEDKELAQRCAAHLDREYGWITDLAANLELSQNTSTKTER